MVKVETKGGKFDWIKLSMLDYYLESGYVLAVHEWPAAA